MSFRAILSSRTLFNVSRSTHIIRTLTTRSRIPIETIAKTGFRKPHTRGFQTTVFRAYAAPKEGTSIYFIVDC
jgi:hypothetical protein